MTRLSVVVITKNEERNIEACLKTVAGWAEEIIVVDDDSSDATVGIARRYTDKVLTRKMDIEGRHRNWAYAQAKNIWVLSLDADERMTEELKQEITETLSKDVEANGFTIPRRNYIGDYWVKHGGWYPSPQLRLFRKDKFRYEEAAVHPRAFMDGVCGHLKSDMVHYSYRDIEDYLHKLNNQTTREAQKWIDQHKPMRLGRFIWRAGDRFLRRYLRKKAYKDGLYGFVIAYFDSLYQLLSYFKYREIMQKEKK